MLTSMKTKESLSPLSGLDATEADHEAVALVCPTGYAHQLLEITGF